MTVPILEVKKKENGKLTSVNLREKVALSPFFFAGSLASRGIKQPLKAPGNDSKRDLSIPKVRIWKPQSRVAKFVPIRKAKDE